MKRLTTGNYCCVPNCGNKGSAGFYRFPRDPIMQQTWRLVCNRTDTRCVNLQVCEFHFSETDFRHRNKKSGEPLKRRLLKKGAIPHISVPYPPQIQDQVQDNSDDDDAGDPLCLSGDSLKTEPAADSSSGQVQAPPASANIVLTGFKRKRNFLEFAEEVSVDLQVGAKKSCPSSSSSSSSLSESATSPAVCQTEEERLHYVIIGLKRVISSLTDENSALKKQVKNLTSVTEKDKEISESEKYAVLKEKLGEHLTPTQIACFYYGGDWKNCVWDKEDLTRAFTLRQLGMSRQAYSHLRAKRILPLPSLSTLKDAKTVLSNTKNKNGQ